MNNKNPLQDEAESTTASSNNRIQKILAPIDFSYYSRKALDYSVYFAQTFQAHLFLLNVLEIPEFDFESLTLEPPKFEEYVSRKINTKLTELAHQAIPRDIQYTKLVEVGVPGQKIVEVAKEHNIDLIIMATHGHSTLEMRIYGSVAQKVIRSANCPVISMNIFNNDNFVPNDEKSLQDIDDLDNEEKNYNEGNEKDNE